MLRNACSPRKSMRIYGSPRIPASDHACIQFINRPKTPICRRRGPSPCCRPATQTQRRIRMHNEPIFDIAHLGHVEILTNKPEASLDFFTRVFGLTESGREGESVYLRAFDDYEFHSLKLTASNATG